MFSKPRGDAPTGMALMLLNVMKSFGVKPEEVMATVQDLAGTAATMRRDQATIIRNQRAIMTALDIAEPIDPETLAAQLATLTITETPHAIDDPGASHPPQHGSGSDDTGGPAPG